MDFHSCRPPAVFRFYARWRGWGRLPLGHSINLVIEDDHVDIDVPNDKACIKWFPPDGHTVAVTGKHPDIQLRVGQFGARSNGQRPSVNRMNAEGVNVVGNARGTSDARDTQEFLFGGVHLGESFLHVGQKWHNHRSRDTIARPDR